MKYFVFLLLIFVIIVSGCKEIAVEESNNVVSEKIDLNNTSEKMSSAVSIVNSEDNDFSTVSETNSIVEEMSEMSTIENSTPEIKTPDMTNLTYSNGSGKMSDTDGPAYVVYSKIGYNRASVDIKVSEIELNNVRKSDGRFVNAYMFLGMDVFDENNNWVNCFDTGLCYSGVNGGWHIFYNLYATVSESTAHWYESDIILNSSHDYRLILDSSEQNGKATMTVFDLTTNKVADSVEMESAYTLKDGSNTSCLQNYALDYPDDVKFDTHGNRSEDDFVEITLYNTDEEIYMKNLTIMDAKISNNQSEFTWSQTQTQNRSMWPDQNVAFDYEVVKVWKNSFDSSFTLSLDMNRE